VKISDDDIVGFLKSTEWPENATLLIPLVYDVWNKLKELGHKNLQAIIENVRGIGV
jgi:hypothetical protein